MSGFDKMATTCQEAERAAPVQLGEEFRPFHGCHQSWLRVGGARARAKIQQLQTQIRQLQLNTPGAGNAVARAKKVQELSAELDRWKHHQSAIARLQDRNQYVVQHLRIMVKERPHLLGKGVMASRGQVLQVLEQNRTWYKVRTAAGQIGYLNKGDLVLGKPLELSSRAGNAGRAPSPEEIEIGGRG